MVPVIGDPTGELRLILNYNEKKVQQKVAKFLHAENFIQGKDKLTFYDKVERFKSQNELNHRCKKNMLHIFLSFHPDDKLTEDQLREIAKLFMERIGFRDQPYLVYQHMDTGQMHLHVVTTLIQANAKRLPTHNLGINEAKKARIEIDKRYGLRTVEDSKRDKGYEPQPLDFDQLQYGKLPTKKAIQDRLLFVLKEYQFTSLPELNAALARYNVIADRGLADSRIYRSGGLVYQALKKGKKVGKPIKASDFRYQPTLAFLQAKFLEKKARREKFLPDIRKRLDQGFPGKPSTIEKWAAELKKLKIEVVIWQNEEGKIYGLTYIDLTTKTVVNGSDLGKAYKAQGILKAVSTGLAALPTHPTAKPKTKASKARRESIGQHFPNANSLALRKKVNRTSGGVAPQLPRSGQTAGHQAQLDTFPSLVPIHTSQSQDNLDSIPYELTIDYREKKKKKKRLHH